MKRLIYSSHSDYVEQFNEHYSKRDFRNRYIADGEVRFKMPSVVSKLLKSFNQQYSAANLELVSDYYEDEDGYNVNYWFVR